MGTVAVFTHARQQQRQLLKHGRVLTQAFGQAHNQLETAVAVEDQTGRGAAHCGGDQILHRLHIKTVARQCGPIWNH